MGRRYGRLFVGGLLACGGLAGAVSYARADSAQRRKAKVAFHGVGRFFRSLSVGMLISLDYWWAGRGLDEESVEYEQAILPCHQRCADRIVAGALKNGGLYIKLGQGLGSFNQVLPKEYTETLKSLLDMALAREFKELDTLFMEDFGKPLSKLFKSFDSTPVAAASLAQVFKAVTHDNKTVAVKAQYIDLRDRYDGDIWTLKVLMKLVAMMHPKFKLSWVFDELYTTLAEELDFEHEGHNLERCGREMAVFPWLYVPVVEWHLTSKRVLTAEWIDGCKVTDRAAITAMGLTFADVAHKVIATFAHQIFHTGFVHADPHPGNIFVRPLPQGGGAQLVLLDHGLYMPVKESTRQSLCQVWKSIIVHDMKTLQRESTKLGAKKYELLSLVLTGRSVDTHRKMFGLGSSAMTKEDWLAVRTTFFDFDETISLLRAMPTSLLLVIRNLNMVRAINRDLGCPVNRYNIMARSAISGCAVTTPPNQWWLKHKVSVWMEQALFELRLLSINIRLWWSVKMLQLMRWVGYVPQEMQILEQAMLT